MKRGQWQAQSTDGQATHVTTIMLGEIDDMRDRVAEPTSLSVALKTTHQPTRAKEQQATDHNLKNLVGVKGGFARA